MVDSELSAVKDHNYFSATSHLSGNETAEAGMLYGLASVWVSVEYACVSDFMCLTMNGANVVSIASDESLVTSVVGGGSNEVTVDTGEGTNVSGVSE